MNWTFVLIGNLIMDIAIIFFAVCSAVEAKFRRMIIEGVIGKIFRSDIRMDKIRAIDKFSDIISPVEGRLFLIIFILFIVGIVLQLIGIFS